MRIPISIKLIVITVILLIGVTIPVSMETSKLTSGKLVEFQQDNNLALAMSKARELNQLFNNLKDKVALNGRLLQSWKEANASDLNYQKEFESNFSLDSALVGIEVFKYESSGEILIGSSYKKPFDTRIAEYRKRSPLDRSEIKEGNFVILNSSIERWDPIITIALPLIKINKTITHYVVADIDLSLVQKTMSDNGLNLFFMTDKNGIVMGHRDETLATKKQNFSGNEIVRLAIQSQMASGMKYLPQNGNQKAMYAAYAKTTFGPIVFSQVEEEQILVVTKELKNNIIQIVGYFLSVALFLVFVFSMTLTSPLETLTGLIHLVSKGNFDVNASKQVKSLFKDEVKELATAFDSMTEGLKERDKVKNLFNKFHGSSVTEDLMKKDVSIGGQTKEVIVFFSDIRGFTAFSEKRKPEEVVSMLNEYFAVMVKIINANGGIVDKFIGDAIMAVWGVPKSTKKDANNAVKACLEMRRALADLNEKRMGRKEPPIQIGMGLHAGSAISGTIGSDERMEYTIIGNTVNTGSRIESSTKAFGSDLLVSDTVLEKVGDSFLTEYAGSAEVKGRSEPLKLHKVRGFKKADGEYEIVVTPYSDYEAEAADKVKIAS
ncbi:MAG: adenylate/guanylate cyclase domain-containing protein [Bdellovibrionaceae bacterium]|nr:adenylate/guanylate cyclase domain-containing protein [Pseudobdellovibrionaceae bacterium]